MAGARLMKLKTCSIYPQQIAHKASYTPRSGPFSQMQSFTGKFVQGWSDLESFLVTPALLFCQSHSWLLARPSEVWHTAPSGGLGLFSSEWPKWSERFVLPTCASCREISRGECSRFCAQQHNCSREYTSVRTGGVPAHSKDLIYNVIVL